MKGVSQEAWEFEKTRELEKTCVRACGVALNPGESWCSVTTGTPGLSRASVA